MAYLKEATCKIFAHGTSFFSIAKNDKLSQNNLNSDLKKKCEWDYQWKMLFNPDLASKQLRFIFQENKMRRVLYA